MHGGDIHGWGKRKKRKRHPSNLSNGREEGKVQLKEEEREGGSCVRQMREYKGGEGEKEELARDAENVRRKEPLEVTQKLISTWSRKRTRNACKWYLWNITGRGILLSCKQEIKPGGRKRSSSRLLFSP